MDGIGARGMRSALAFILAACLAGCSSMNKRDYESNKDYGEDLQHRLDRAGEEIARLKQAEKKALADAAALEKQLTGEREIHAILEQRVDNLRRVNDNLTEELTGVVMNAGGSRGVSSSTLVKVSGATAASFDLPPELTKSLTDLAKQNVQMTFDPAQRLCRLPSNLLFVKGGDQLDPSGQAILRKLAAQLAADKASRFHLLIVGHGSTPVPSRKDLLALHPTDWHLAAHQGIAVQQYLEECGILPARVGVISYGSHQPLVEGTDDVARQKNERIEIYILPPE